MHKQKKFLGARIEPAIMNMIERVSEEKKIDKTSALKILVITGWKEINLEKALQLYQEGKIAVDKAAKIADRTVSEMMDEIAAHNIRSNETIEEYRQGIKRLLESDEKEK